MNDERLLIRGTAVDRVDVDGALAAVRGFLDASQESGSLRSALIVTPNCEIARSALKDADLRAALGAADLVIPDGAGMYLSSKILGEPLPQRMAGIDLCFEILKLCAAEGRKVFLLGGKACAPCFSGWSAGKSVAQLAAQRLAEQIPGLKVCGTRDGYFSDAEEIGVVDQINESGADFLVAGLGSPRQELFLFRNLKDLRCKACMGVGGSLDVWSGCLKRAPEWMTRCGLEWLYRLWQEPRRIRRIARIPGFMAGVLFRR